MSLGAASDARLLTAIARGERAGLMAAFDRYAGTLLALCRQMTGAAAEADEVVHDVFVELWQGAWRIRQRQVKLRTWLVLRSRLLCRQLLAHAPELAAQAEAEPVGARVWRPPTAAAGGPFAAERRIVWRAVRRQSARQRGALARAFLAPHRAPEAGGRRPMRGAQGAGRRRWHRCQAALYRALRAIEHR